MKQALYFLPRKLNKEEIALAPTNWVQALTHYRYRRRRAIREIKPGYNTLLASAMAAIAKKDRNLIDIAKELTKIIFPKTFTFPFLVLHYAILTNKKANKWHVQP